MKKKIFSEPKHEYSQGMSNFSVLVEVKQKLCICI